MTLAVNEAIRVLRAQCDLDQDMEAELAERLLSGELHHPTWSKNDGTITVKLIGDEGKILGDTREDFVELMTLIMEQINEDGAPDVEYSLNNGLPELHANFDFFNPGMAKPQGWADRITDRLTPEELAELWGTCHTKLELGGK